jgi:sulfite exporter TauE/SafE
LAEHLLASLQALCGARPGLAWLGDALQGAGLPLALLLLGTVGGLSHCAGMCGPFVLAQIASDGARLTAPGVGELRRLRGALLLPYQLGRFTTYTALGALAGGGAGLASALTGLGWLPSLFLVLAALLFLAAAVASLAPRLALAAVPAFAARLAAPLARALAPLFADPRGWRGYAIGLSLGFLPCGLLYSALAAAAGSGSAWRGALAMAGFVLGTAGALVLVGYVGVFFGRRAPSALRRLAAPLLALNAGFVGWLALRALA